MKRKNIIHNEDGQVLLLACVSIVLALALMMVYELATLDTGESSINRENINSFYTYKNMRDRYTDIYNDPTYWNFNNSDNISALEMEMGQFALLHGYGLNINRNNSQAIIIFKDKDLMISEVIKKH